jgi:hypothetical protein
MKFAYTTSRAIPSTRLVRVAAAIAADDFKTFDTRAG